MHIGAYGWLAHVAEAAGSRLRLCARGTSGSGSVGPKSCCALSCATHRSAERGNARCVSRRTAVDSTGVTSGAGVGTLSALSNCTK